MNLNGVYRGTVGANNDPTGRGRVKVSVPATGVDSVWAPVCLAGGGPVAMIQVGATVVVAFEGGDATRPIVLGRLP
jgi:hypothetical protein